MVAQTQAGLTRMLLDELFAVRTASVEALIGARHQADTLYESEQGSLLRGTRQFVTRHKAFCYAAQGRPLRGTSSLLRDIMWFGHTRHATWAQYMRCQLPCVSMTMPKSHRV